MTLVTKFKTIIMTILLLLGLSLPAFAAKRVALVLGVGDYENTQALRNPVKDAKGVAAALRLAGFDVTLATDVSQAEFGRSLQRFENKLDDADAALFYFAGHGIQIGQKNYLLSADARVQNPHLIDSDGIQLDRIIKVMEENADIAMAFVDACRDNPLANQMRKNNGKAARSLGLKRGLAPINRPFSNSLIAFATAPGDIALDGETINSPFTEALLKHLLEPNVEISTMLKRVTRDVLASTDGAQKPEVITSMAQEFYFINPQITINNNLNVEDKNNTFSSSDPEAQATALLAIARDMKSIKEKITAFELVRSQYPNTVSAKLAGLLIEEELKDSELSRDEVVSESFDNSVLSALDVEAALAEGRAKKRAKATPEEIELALNLGKADVTRIQTALNAMGYNVGTADGAFGNKSREGLREFQRIKRVSESGYLTRDTINSIIETFQSTPKSYDGNWTLSIYRKWLVADKNSPGTKAGDIELIATVDLESRDGEFFMQSNEVYTVKPTQPFASFKTSLSNNGTLSVRTKASTHFSDANNKVAKERNLTAQMKLPQLFPYGKQLSVDANVFEREMRFHIKLHRKRS